MRKRACCCACGRAIPQFRRDGFARIDRKSTRLNSSHLVISYAVFCLKKKKRRCKFVLCSYGTRRGMVVDSLVRMGGEMSSKRGVEQSDSECAEPRTTTSGSTRAQIRH